MAPALSALAGRIGAPIIRDILARRIGRENAELASDVVGMIAKRAGVAPEAVEQLAIDEPDRVMTAMTEIEADVAELAPLYAAEVAARQAAFAAERDEPLWVRAWRPLGMYGIGILWFWNLILLHVANAVWKIALPPTDPGVLMQISALYMSLYMGGHTVKDLMSKWTGRA